MSRESANAASRRWYVANREEILARRTAVRRARAAQERAKAKAWREANPDKVRAYRASYRAPGQQGRARAAVGRAVAAGTLEREPCLFCGAERVEAHHHDYDAPLDVTWLCSVHHALAHRAL